MTKQLNRYLTSVVAGIVVCAGAGSALANDYHNTGDLILAFQNPGGETGSDKVVLVSLGNAAQLYRGATANTLNIANIGTILTQTFGANWYDSSTLYMSALSAWNSSTIGNSLSNGDPLSTVYLTRARSEMGVFGESASNTWSGLSTTNLSGAASKMLAVASNLEAGTTQAISLGIDSTNYDAYNPFVGVNQGTAYDVFTSGAQFQFGSLSFGLWEGQTIEGALDLYRFQAKNNVTNQYGFGETNGYGVFQGSILIDNLGNVSYAAVPEPTSMILLGGAGVALLFRRRFKKVSADI